MAKKSGKWQREYVPLDVDSVTRGWTRSESRDDGGAWKVRTVGGGDKSYRCPGCDQIIPPGTPHTVAWPADHLLGAQAGWRIAVIGTPRVGERDDRPHGATSAQIATLKHTGIDPVLWPRAAGSYPGYVFTDPPLSLAAGHFGLGNGSGAHAPDEYYLIESSNPKVQGFDGATMSFVEYLYELAK